MLTKPKVGPTYHGIPGVFALADLPRYPSVSSIAWTTGWAELDEIYRLYPGQFTVVHGATNHGKSTFLFNLVVNQVAQLGRRVFLYVPENERTLWDRLSMIWGDRSEDAWRVASEMGILIGSSVRKYADPPRTLPWILETGLEVHRIQKLDLMILDPWNEIEFSRPREMSQTEFIGECLKYITGFCREHDLTLILSAHPTKTGVQDGKIPGPYDVDGSAHWANKPDNVLCVWRGKGSEVRVISQKVREIGAGARGGVCYFTVEDETGVFTAQYGGSGVPNT